MIKGMPVLFQGSLGDPTIIGILSFNSHKKRIKSSLQILLGFGPFEQTKYLRAASFTRSKYRTKSARLTSVQSPQKDENETLILPAAKSLSQMKLPEVAIDVSTHS